MVRKPPERALIVRTTVAIGMEVLMLKAWLALVGSVVLCAIALLLVSPATRAMESPTLGWFTVDGGGGAATDAGRSLLTGSIGQPDAGLLTSGGFSLGGGFWDSVVTAVEHDIYLPLIMRAPPA
jgi:hypothetical protein